MKNYPKEIKLLSQSDKIPTDNTRTLSNETYTPCLSTQLLILNLIFDNNFYQIQRLNLHKQNLNFLQEFKHLPLDLKVSPLVLASYLGRWDVVKLLLMSQNVDVNLGTNDAGFTPLSVACISGHYEIAKLLTDYGADVNLQNQMGHSPLQHCFSRLEEEKNYFENQMICLQMADLILENGGEIDTIVNEKKGYTLLMVFCSIQFQLNRRETQENADVIRFLVEHGADMEILSRKQKNVYEIVEKHPNQERLKEILQTTIVKSWCLQQKLKRLPQLREIIQNSQDQCVLEGKVGGVGGKGCCSIWNIFSFE